MKTNVRDKIKGYMTHRTFVVKLKGDTNERNGIGCRPPVDTDVKLSANILVHKIDIRIREK